MKSPVLDIMMFAIGIALLAVCTGCATKTRNIDLDGMYLTEAGTLAIGSIEVMASPVGEESAAIRYAEDTAWLSPSTKTHEIKILLTGTNAVQSANGIVSNICAAFTATAPYNNVEGFSKISSFILLVFYFLPYYFYKKLKQKIEYKIQIK